ncbi:LPS export ABC transporter permease LptG [Andreprevotia chitinilytica]|uniref:LPS export ABC transporter permease LptG n=1 Tax=Andreprevotia chitinilytica TaxID=396808 RepID=UPI000552B1F2|nr:LPS export ABC transporter permease LptG [Andreprevotia chitinilytica]
MSLLARYLFREVTLYVLFTLAGLLGLYTFFDLITELSSLGKGGYRLIDALIYVLLQIPSNGYELMPIAALIGGIFALAALSGQSELTVMRASGVSIRRLLLWLLGIGIVYGALTVALGEYVAPAAKRMANQYRLSATKAMLVGEFRSGVWVKDGKQIINISEMLPDLTILGIRIYEFGDGLTLTRMLEGDEGSYIDEGNWQLRGARETRFAAQDGGVKVQAMPQTTWQTQVSPEMLAVLLVEPAQMSARALYSYIDHLSSNRQKTSRYELALWGKLFYPLACISMLVIALPFSQTQRRSSGTGLKLFAGIIVGLSFHFLNRIVIYLGELKNWPPPLVVSIPTVLFMLVALVMLWRQEKR